MITEAKIIARFGKMPTTSDGMKNICRTLMNEMPSFELQLMRTTVKSDQSLLDNPWTNWGMQEAEKILEKRGDTRDVA